jgi:hypothetical protein
MSGDPQAFWADETSVFFTSFWGWSPDKWGTIGWTGKKGLTRRTNLLNQLSDPFIAVIYVTKWAGTDQDGKIVGFYLVSHETGHRTDFTHHSLHAIEPDKWVHSLRAIRAFSYVPEYCLEAASFDPSLVNRAQPVAKWGEVLTDRRQIDRLRNTPWVEVPVYDPTAQATTEDEELAPTRGFNRAGPANRNGYVVSSSALLLERQIYILRLDGCTDSYLGKKSNGRRIYKIGLSASPDLRRQSLQSGMPEGAFHWIVYHHSGNSGQATGLCFEAAVAGENAMKKYLAQHANWLGGEFYLTEESHIDQAWELGCAAAKSFRKP